jgi:hypothetical protein
MNHRHYWAMACATLTALMLSAAEPPNSKPAAATDPPVPAPTATPAATAASASTAMPVPVTAPAASAVTAAQAAHADEPARFEATEKVRADFEVSFPVDI